MWSLLQVYLTHLEETPCVFLYISMSYGKFLIVWTSICKILSLPRLHLPLPPCSHLLHNIYYTILYTNGKLTILRAEPDIFILLSNQPKM